MDNPLKGLDANQKKFLGVVAIGAGGYVAWRWYRSGQTEEPTYVTSGTDADGAGTGIIGSNVGGSENVGNSSNAGSGNDLIDTNNEWFAEAVEKLTSGGWNVQAVQSALGDFLTGQSLTTSEASIVRAAVGAMGGYPPNGPTSVKEIPGETDASKLAAPTGLKVVSRTTSSVVLSWSAVSGAKQYRVYRSGVASNIAGTTTTSVTVGGLQPNTSYTFYVAAGIDGEKMGPRSGGVTTRTTAVKLAAPTGLAISKVGRTDAFLRWKPVSGGGGYLIRRSGSSKTWELADPATGLHDLKPGTRYSYQVAAVSPGTRTPGPWSSYVTFTTKR